LKGWALKARERNAASTKASPRDALLLLLLLQ
jgi:hypothetical protein